MNAIALAIQNRGGSGPHQSLLDSNRTEKCPTGIATKGTEFDDISKFYPTLLSPHLSWLKVYMCKLGLVSGIFEVIHL